MPQLQAQVSPVHFRDWLQNRGRHNAFSGLINLLNWPTELRSPVYLLDYLIKEITQQLPDGRGRDLWGQVCAKGCGASMPFVGVPPAQHLDVFVHQHRSSLSPFWGFMEASYTGAIH